VEVHWLIPGIAGLFAATSAAYMAATRSIVKTVMLLIVALASVSIMLYEAWGLGLAAAYFMLAVGGLSILILLAASIVEPHEEPPREGKVLGLAALPGLVVALLVYRASEGAPGFSKPVFFTNTGALVAGLLVFSAVLLGLAVIASREVRRG